MEYKWAVPFWLWYSMITQRYWKKVESKVENSLCKSVLGFRVKSVPVTIVSLVRALNLKCHRENVRLQNWNCVRNGNGDSWFIAQHWIQFDFFKENKKEITFFKEFFKRK